ncbi:MAG: guanylate kinase [Muribaculum sp.]|nr:guanylate kinase [Muribaculaceae bacterium]MCM1081694.1 guanylate kinase [Muribaculum sp.]
MAGKIIIISAPSGCGKSTIISALLKRGVDMHFSISATSREPRKGEIDGVHYYFLSESEFRSRIETGMFVEYEEVYPGRFYGTLKSEIERITSAGHNVVLDIDVVGAMNVKKIYGNRALTLFIMPPSVDELRRRLVARNTDAPEVIEQRVDKAELEISYAPNYEAIVVNDNLVQAVNEAETIICNFIAR